MIEDIIAQSHVLVDTFTFDAGIVALSALRTISGTANAGAGPLAQVLGVTFTEFGEGRCSATLEVCHHLLNPMGIAHGGVAYALADFACGGAALSTLGEARVVTQDMNIRYHGPARPGRIVARAETVHKGSRTVTTYCRVTQGETLVATASGTFAILSDAELGEMRQ